MTSSDVLRVGVVGAGNIATLAHLPGLQRAPGARVVAICDRDIGRAEVAASRFGIEGVYDDHRQMLERSALDALTIATPPAEHTPLALAAIEQGLHVLCEKPLSTNVGDAEAMVQGADRAGVVLAMNLHFRVMRESLALKAAIDAGHLGSVRYIHIRYLRHGFFPPTGSWVKDPAISGGGALADMGSHLIDLAMWLTGSRQATKVASHLHSIERGHRDTAARGIEEGEDFASLRWLTDRGVVVTVECSWGYFGPDESRIQVIGAHGGADVFVKAGRSGSFRFYSLSDDGRVTEAPFPHGSLQDRGSASLAVMTRGSSARGPRTGPNPRSRLWFRTVASFVTAARGEGVPVASGRDGLVVQRIIEAAYASAGR